MDGTRQEKIGIVGTYNQDWALTQYLKRFCEQFTTGQAVILAEDVLAARAPASELHPVFPCWKRNSQDYSRLLDVVARENIRVLNVNCCFPFFDNHQFNEAMTRLKRQGVAIVAHVHDDSAFGTVTEFLCSIADSVIVDNSRAKLRAVLSGVPTGNIEVIFGAVQEQAVRDNKAIRQQLGVPARQRALVGFDLGASTERLEALVQALYELHPARAAVHLYIVHLDPMGSATGSGPSQVLARQVASLHLEGFVHFVHAADTESVVSDYLQASDVVVLSNGRPLYELREVLARALANGRPVLASTPLPFDGLESCCFVPEGDTTLAKALDLVLNSEDLRAVLRSESLAWVAARNTESTAETYRVLYERLGCNAAALTKPRAATDIAAVSMSSGTTMSSSSHPAGTGIFSAAVTSAPALRILMQNRQNAHSHPGGDTVVMDRLSSELRSMGHTVDVDVQCVKNPKDYDLTHLYNFAIREATEQMAKNSFASGVPYVVTTLYEDWPVFFNQMANVFYATQAYIQVGQPRDKWQGLLEAAKDVEPSKPWDNSWTANHAHALLASGANERAALLRDYPGAKRIEICPFGCEVVERGDGGERFTRETGLKDFVFMVGRLEGRKNQLMLLKALEDSDHTVVFATGGFTYQPEYEAACRAFKRKGKTVFLGRLEADLLASAFGAAKVHALPSWFELPGLVSLEAARYGTNVVVSDFGTARDYFGDLVSYCSPDDDRSIFAAVSQAYERPASSELARHVAQYTWRRAAEIVQNLYRSVLAGGKAESTQTTGFSESIHGARTHAHVASQTVVKIPEVVGRDSNDAVALARATAFCVEGDTLFSEGKLSESQASYAQALTCVPGYARAARSLGVCALSAKEYNQADQHFRSALRADPSDTKALVGLGAAIWELDRKEEAFEMYRRASEADTGGASLLYLINAAYALDKLAELETVLRRALKNDRESLDLQYCLAGCYFRQQKYALAGGVIERILQISPEHPGARELRDEVARKTAGDEQSTAAAAGTSVPAGLRGANDSPVSSSATIRYDLELVRLEQDKKSKCYDAVIAGASSIIDSAQASEHQRAFARILKGESLACRGETGPADAEFLLAIDDPMYGYRACAGRGAVAASQGNHQAAQTLFQRALSLRPEYDIAVTGLGICAQMSGESDLAWNFYHQAFSVNPENTKALFGLIQLGYQMGRMPEIEAALREYLDMHPVDLGMVYSLAGCLYAQGRCEEAGEECRRILLFEPRHELANELLEKLQENERQGAYAQR